MTNTRVGVLTHDNALIVDLSLRATGMSVTGIDSVEDLRDYDVVLVDVQKGADPLETLMRVPAGPARVVLCHGPMTVVPEAGPVTIVERPCSLAELLDAVRSARQAPVPVGVGAPTPSTSPLESDDGAEVKAEPDDGLVIVLDDADPAPTRPMAPMVPTRLFTRETLARSGKDQAITSGVDSDVVPGGQELAGDDPDGQALEADILTAVADDLATWAVAREPGLDARSLGDRLAERLAEVMEADSMVIWDVGDNVFTILGAFGITDAARDARIAADHPVLRLAHTHGGVYLRTSGHAGARAPGFPGAGSDSYAVIVLPDEAGPAALLTVGAPELPPEFAEGLRNLMLDVASLWPVS